jgi:hypothetical protein
VILGGLGKLLDVGRSRRLWGCDIFSEPTTATVSYMPASTAMQARCSAVEPLAHAFSTLTVGMPP